MNAISSADIQLLKFKSAVAFALIGLCLDLCGRAVAFEPSANLDHPAIHGAFQGLQPVDLAFSLPVALRQFGGVSDSIDVPVKRSGKRTMGTRVVSVASSMHR